jgi:hypothetical protein
MTFRQLDSSRIVDTVEQLCLRIEERFPGAGLGRVAGDLLALSRECATEAQLLARPNVPIRIAVWILIIVMVLGMVIVLTRPWAIEGIPTRFSGIGEYVQAIEAAVNDIVFVGVAIFFLITIETRVKRRVALRAVHRLRSIAHVVDMHQLTKDPEKLASTEPDTASSPQRRMSADELGRYLDYCSEMLSLTSKLAALYPQHFNDPVTLEAVNDVENLTTGLSRKIWQKISVLQGVVRA